MTKNGVRYLVLGCIIWSLLITIPLLINIKKEEVDNREIAHLMTLASFQKDVAYHLWSAQLGGIYVLRSPEKDVSKRPQNSITTITGQRLFLITPAEMLRQTQELTAEKFNIYGHFTSLKPLRPGNAPDAWERKALELFEQNPQEVDKIESLKGKPFFRLMRPLIVEKSCLECHASQGYKEGDIRGGLSASISMEPFEQIKQKHILFLYFGYTFVWFLGIIILLLAWWVLRSKVKALEKATTYIQSVIDGIAEPVMVIDCHDYHVALANKIVREMTEIDPVRQGKKCYQISHHRDIPCQEAGELCPLAEVKATKKIVKITHVHLDAQDRQRTYSIVASPVLNQKGEVIQIIESNRDITQELNLESQLQQAQKMEAIGLLAGGVAHDFNNLLTGILGHTRLLKLDSRPEDKVYQAATTIEVAAERAANLTVQLLGFARGGKLQNVSVNLHKVVQEVLDLLQHTLEKNIVIKQQLTAQNPYVLGDPGQLGQVILNLAVNARDAMQPQGGELVFQTSSVHIAENDPQQIAGLKPGKYLQVSVTDTGRGIAKEFLGRIFEPFFTTKELGEGSGMGLAMVYGIVKNHHGLVQVKSEVGNGSKFDIYLPETVNTNRETSSGLAVPSDLQRGSECILLADDEEMIRLVTREMLERLGYRVITVADGREALAIYEKKQAEIDLVLLDLSMPVMGGRECFLALQQLNPLVKIIISTGYGVDNITQELMAAGLYDVIQKPYRFNALAAKVREVLDY